MFNASNLASLMGGMGSESQAHQQQTSKADTSEQIYISSLALLKMLKHARSGVPLEVMGLMLGEFIDDYSIKVIDVFAMPQSGTSVSVESVDPVYQQEMLDMLKQTKRSEMVVGWYHSHPSFGCWLSSVDINTQQSFEQLHPRCVAVVVDPIQSVRGKVVIDAFRLINPMTIVSGGQSRQTTSNSGYLNKPSVQAMFKGLGRYYYSININYKTNELQQKMLLNLYKQKWTTGMSILKPGQLSQKTCTNLQKMGKWAIEYAKRIDEETKKSSKELLVKNTGKLDPKKHLNDKVEEILNDNIINLMGSMISSKAF